MDDEDQPEDIIDVVDDEIAALIDKAADCIDRHNPEKKP